MCKHVSFLLCESHAVHCLIVDLLPIYVERSLRHPHISGGKKKKREIFSAWFIRRPFAWLAMSTLYFYSVSESHLINSHASLPRVNIKHSLGPSLLKRGTAKKKTRRFSVQWVIKKHTDWWACGEAEQVALYRHLGVWGRLMMLPLLYSLVPPSGGTFQTPDIY